VEGRMGGEGGGWGREEGGEVAWEEEKGERFSRIHVYHKQKRP